LLYQRLNTPNCAWFGSQISARTLCPLQILATPLEFSSEQDDISVEIWLRLQNYFGIIPKNQSQNGYFVIDSENILLPLHNFLRITKALTKFIL